jgi:hypothetical protein
LHTAGLFWQLVVQLGPFVSNYFSMGASFWVRKTTSFWVRKTTHTLQTRCQNFADSNYKGRVWDWKAWSLHSFAWLKLNEWINGALTRPVWMVSLP